MSDQAVDAQGSFTGVKVQGRFVDGEDEIFVVKRWRVSGEVGDGSGLEW